MSEINLEQVGKLQIIVKNCVLYFQWVENKNRNRSQRRLCDRDYMGVLKFVIFFIRIFREKVCKFLTQNSNFDFIEILSFIEWYVYVFFKLYVLLLFLGKVFL